MKYEREKFIEKLKEFERVAEELEEAWDELDDKAFYVPCDGYPFENSFDEVSCMVSCWVKNTIENLQNMGG